EWDTGAIRLHHCSRFSEACKRHVVVVNSDGRHASTRQYLEPEPGAARHVEDALPWSEALQREAVPGTVLAPQLRGRVIAQALLGTAHRLIWTANQARRTAGGSGVARCAREST